MKPVAFDYYAPAALDEALTLLARLGENAKLLAGGQSLMPLLNIRLARPQAIVDLNRVSELFGARREGDTLCLGAMTRHQTLERDPVILSTVPLLAEAARHIAHLQIRTRGTIGGSLANASPGAELPAVVTALEGELIVRATGGAQRVMHPEQFFVGPMQTALAVSEILVEVRIPIPANDTGWALAEFARRHGDFALAGAVALVRFAPDGKIAIARLVLFGVSGVPLRARHAEALLVGTAGTGTDLDRVEASIGASIEPLGDLYLSADSRREVAGVIARRALEQAIARARTT
jgi:carbon-monoxide dehydrogenase medium subunit